MATRYGALCPSHYSRIKEFANKQVKLDLLANETVTGTSSKPKPTPKPKSKRKWVKYKRQMQKKKKEIPSTVYNYSKNKVSRIIHDVILR